MLVTPLIVSSPAADAEVIPNTRHRRWVIADNAASPPAIAAVRTYRSPRKAD
jgi:hypothetical protein